MARSVLASCGLADEPFCLSILGRAIACLVVDEPDTSTWRCKLDIIASVYHDLQNALPASAVPAGCGADCSQSHAGDGACLVCGRGWGPHSGHRCREGTRGSWRSSAAPPVPVQQAPTQLTPMRMHGKNFRHTRTA